MKEIEWVRRGAIWVLSIDSQTYYTVEPVYGSKSLWIWSKRDREDGWIESSEDYWRSADGAKDAVDVLWLHDSVLKRDYVAT